jgi:hypothetical protein
MKSTLILLLLSVMALSACQISNISPTGQPSAKISPTPVSDLTEEISQPSATGTSTLVAVPTPSVTTLPPFTSPPTPTTTLTPELEIDWSLFDPDIKPPIEILHSEPLIVKSDESIDLKFNFTCAYKYKTPGANCDFNPALFVSYTEKNDFTTILLQREILEGGVYWTAVLPATDENGKPFRYYLLVNDPQVGLDVRFPSGGTIGFLAVPAFIPMNLLDQTQAEQGELVLAVPWGSGPEKVGVHKREGYPLREGPSAIDVAEDGRIALLDIVNNRVLIYDPKDQTYSNIPLPFVYKGQGVLQFDREGQLAIFDMVGAPIEKPTVYVPLLYRMTLDGSVDQVAPAFATSPIALTKELKVLDLFDWRLVEPFDPTGKVNSREVQRNKQTLALPYRFVENLDPYTARFGDAETGLAYEIHSGTPLGAITYFERTPQGYVVIFHSDNIRAVWFDPSGNVLKDVSMPNDQFSEILVHGQVSIDNDGSLFILGSTPRGIEVRYVEAP